MCWPNFNAILFDNMIPNRESGSERYSYNKTGLRQVSHALIVTVILVNVALIKGKPNERFDFGTQMKSRTVCGQI